MPILLGVILPVPVCDDSMWFVCILAASVNWAEPKEDDGKIANWNACYEAFHLVQHCCSFCTRPYGQILQLINWYWQRRTDRMGKMVSLLFMWSLVVVVVVVVRGPYTSANIEGRPSAVRSAIINDLIIQITWEKILVLKQEVGN